LRTATPWDVAETRAANLGSNPVRESDSSFQISGKLLADRHAPPQFVEEVQQQGHNEQVSFEGELSVA
jgi:hypothetical protein